MSIRPSTAAWGALIGGVLAYEAYCPNGEMLSERVDVWIENHPVITYATIGMTALHLANLLPPSVDLIHQIGRLKRENN
jgi:hypothetical protein